MQDDDFAFHIRVGDRRFGVEKWLNVHLGDGLADNASFFPTDDEQNANPNHHEHACEQKRENGWRGPHCRFFFECGGVFGG